MYVHVWKFKWEQHDKIINILKQIIIPNILIGK